MLSSGSFAFMGAVFTTTPVVLNAGTSYVVVPVTLRGSSGPVFINVYTSKALVWAPLPKDRESMLKVVNVKDGEIDSHPDREVLEKCREAGAVTAADLSVPQRAIDALVCQCALTQLLTLW